MGGVLERFRFQNELDKYMLYLHSEYIQNKAAADARNQSRDERACLCHPSFEGPSKPGDVEDPGCPGPSGMKRKAENQTRSGVMSLTSAAWTLSNSSPQLRNFDFRFSDSRGKCEFKNRTNEPTKLLKTNGYSFCTNQAPENTEVISLTNQVPKKSSLLQMHALKLRSVLEDCGLAAPIQAQRVARFLDGIQTENMRNQKLYEQTRQVVENKQNSFLLFGGGRQISENSAFI